MYFIVPIEKEKTLLYVANSKKVLLNIGKDKLILLIDKLFKKKLSKEHEKYLLLDSLLKKNDKYRIGKIKLANSIQLILDERVRGSMVSEYMQLNDFISSYNPLVSSSGKMDLLVGLIFDDIFLDKIEKNKALLKDKWCMLIGLEDSYFFKIGTDICAKCLQMRRITNLCNTRENIITEEYLNSNRSGIEMDEHYLPFLSKMRFDKQSGEFVYTYNKKQNIIQKARLVSFPGCPTCNHENEVEISKDACINEQFGIIKHLSTDVEKIGELTFFVSSSSVAKINAISFLKNNLQVINPNISGAYSDAKYSSAFSLFRPIICGGVSFCDKKISELKAFGESLERYCAAYLDEEKIQKNNTRIFSEEKDCPWILYNDKQYNQSDFPFKKLDKKSDIFYVEGVSLVNNLSRFIPASFVFIRYPLCVSDVGIYPTTGLVCGKNIERMRIDGICENIERDACMLTWLLSIIPKKIVNIENKDISSILKNFKRHGVDVQLFELSIDLELPVVLALGINKKLDFPKIFIGSSCKPNKDAAIIKSLEELTQGFSWKNLVERYGKFNFGKKFENITHFEHHALFFATLEKMSILDFILKTRRVIEYKDMKSGFKYDDIIEIFKNKFDVIETDLTTSDVKGLGYTVKKIMIPGLQPLNSNHRLNFGDRRRINSVKKYLKAGGIRFSNKLNTYPHPFP
jgi:ribosomal protein S12 methylthiotransferase accessory factor